MAIQKTRLQSLIFRFRSSIHKLILQNILIIFSNFQVIRRYKLLKWTHFFKFSNSCFIRVTEYSLVRTFFITVNEKTSKRHCSTTYKRHSKVAPYQGGAKRFVDKYPAINFHQHLEYNFLYCFQNHKTSTMTRHAVREERK